MNATEFSGHFQCGRGIGPNHRHILRSLFDMINFLAMQIGAEGCVWGTALECFSGALLAMYRMNA
jgi:hypothetical protein